MEVYLPSLPMMKILSYLDAYSLLQVAQVNKNWNELASSDVLWRRLCQKRWFYCDMVTLPLHGKETWKQFFIYRTWQEHAKSRAKPEDFTYKEIPVKFEFWAHPCYISRHGLTRNGQGKSAICMVTSVNRISTWDIHEGAMTWVSPVQPSYIMQMTTLPEMHIAVTVDMQSTIKLWDCHNREVLATKALSFSCQLLQAEFTKDGPIVLVGDVCGNLYIFRIPDLYLISKVNVFPYSIDELYCSPQKKWVFLMGKRLHDLIKVFYMSSLLRPSEFSAPVSTVLEVPLIRKVFWTPRREDRITLISTVSPQNNTKFDTFDMKLEGIGNKVTIQEYLTASFSLAEREGKPDYFGVSDKDVIVCSTGSSLLLFDINGLRLQTFQYCPEEIWKLWVDPVHVIVTCNDGSLDVYAWEERSLLLRKCYRLLNRRYQPPSALAISVILSSEEAKFGGAHLSS
ncbi:F-box and WD-40 domain protein 22 isoform X4 [Mus musculus]|uniref:F-box and WD-40 domain protein 22 isoform X4 n=1 Tax=Mus musculus TaxID=10090 RepID=UPI0003D700A7|nr:F-box and WD-40 domain protein 22 isoform X4 [Mus musculus]|eukprot:XP_006512244.1 PREDICTED: F-box and WD-40 domain protein 22 isoform X5 [Mus musculus]